MEGNTFFTPQEHEQLITLYKRLLQLSKDTLQKGTAHYAIQKTTTIIQRYAPKR